ncbi:uncharacterized protein DUF2846 [Azomonas agilis]|uniref:Uncharacterized protein DUF2846 n=1 Tax=Azomonas agilis TaxID=116849 RepID=A0A562I0L7_9GAMM|nr:DUF2846 domain-containing protein [Azomonas agilis]TWH64587.1 uncharacterized protein DUF2846 [Azomonas agilis]
MKKISITPLVIFILLSGCASVPSTDTTKANEVKKFKAPQNEYSGVYIYRKDAMLGSALKKDIYIDGKCVGESAPGVFFYSEVDGDREHTIGTESEFSPNNLKIFTEKGKLYFIEQYIKFGFFVGGADLKSVEVQEGKTEVIKTDLAIQGNCSSI